MRPSAALHGRGECILVCEHEAGVGRLIHRILYRNGFTVPLTALGEEALRAFEELNGHVHLLLTGVVMPGMSGKELADLLVEREPAMKSIYMSGYTDDIIARHGVFKEGEAYLPKPFDAAGLLRAVEAMLERSSFGEKTSG